MPLKAVLILHLHIYSGVQVVYMLWSGHIFFLKKKNVADGSHVKFLMLINIVTYTYYMLFYL